MSLAAAAYPVQINAYVDLSRRNTVNPHTTSLEYCSISNKISCRSTKGCHDTVPSLLYKLQPDRDSRQAFRKTIKMAAGSV